MNSFELKLEGRPDVWPHLLESKKGIEREALRVDQLGRISNKPHPILLGSALTNPNITTDYSESLLELVTPPVVKLTELEHYLLNLHYFIYPKIDGELLWTSSMPFLHEKNQLIPIAFYGNSAEGQFKTIYRKGLGIRYGNLMQSIAGVHFNFSFSSNFLKAYLSDQGDPKDFKNNTSEFYMHLSRNYRRFSFFLVYLFGASPLVSKNYSGHPKTEFTDFDTNTWLANKATSLRMSDIGYNNSSRSELNCSLNSLGAYISDLRSALTTRSKDFSLGENNESNTTYSQLNDNLLQIENEYYANVRPKANLNLDERPIVGLQNEGVSYIEIRSIDLNPFSPIGIDKSQMQLAELFLIACALWESEPIDKGELNEIDIRDLLVAKNGNQNGLSLPYKGRHETLEKLVGRIFSSLERVASMMGNDYEQGLQLWKGRFKNKQTLSSEFIERLSESNLSYQDFILMLSKSHEEFTREQFTPDGALQERLAQSTKESLQSQKKKEDESVSLEDYLSAKAKQLQL
jgi:glutamate--cysteine ligase